MIYGPAPRGSMPRPARRNCSIACFQILLARRGVQRARRRARPARPQARFAGRAPGSSSPTGRAALSSKRAPVQRNAMAPLPRQIRRSTRMAAHGSFASRGLTTTAARLQSSARASSDCANDISRPSDRRPMQPMASQTIPFCNVASLGVTRVAVGGEPFLEREGVAAVVQHRQPAVRPADRRGPAVGGDQHVRAAASSPPRAQAKNTSTRATPAQRRAQQADQQQAGGARAAAARCRRLRCGRPRPAGCATHSATAIIQSMPAAHQPPEHAVEAERHGDERRGCPSA